MGTERPRGDGDVKQKSNKFLGTERMKRIWILFFGEKPVRIGEFVLMSFWWGGATIALGYYWFWVRPQKLRERNKGDD